MAKGITASEMGKRGGTARARAHSKVQIQKWGKLGGRPAKLDRRAVTRLRKLLACGKSQAECASVFGVSTRTIGRLVAGIKSRDPLKPRGDSKKPNRLCGNSLPSS